jgi:hypothetical protein
MMNDDEPLRALLATREPIADDGFSARVLALAALEDRLAVRRRAAFRRVAKESAALTAILAAFSLLARLAPTGDVVPLASPAMVGMLLLTSWLAIGMRGARPVAT